MSWESVIDLLYKPPAWIISIIVAILVSKALRKIIPPLRKKESGLIFILEIMMCGVIGYLTLNAFLKYYIDPNKISPDDPFNLLYLFITVTFASILIYMYANRRSSSRQ